ncbi:MAG TPA: PIG-L family deacetylase [Edaphobacter sp.]
MKILVLGPHRGDAAFSLAVSMGNWLAAGHRVTILNVFSRSLYAPYSDAEFVHENDRLSYVSAMRRREDERFVQQVVNELPKAAKANLQMVDLNLKDAPLRLRCAQEDVCDLGVNPEDPAIGKLRKALDQQVGAREVDALVLPLGLGEHVDHLTVRAAALPLTVKLPSAFYEDLPYAATHPSAATDLQVLREETGAQLREELQPVLNQRSDLGDAWKRRLMLGYASQIDDDEAARVGEFAARYEGGERLWVNERWMEIAEAFRLSASA